MNTSRKSGSKVLIAFCLLLLCCSPAILKPLEQDLARGKEKDQSLTMQQLNSGYEVYNGKCGSCHMLFRPSKYTEEQWAKILPVMSKKAKLSPGEHEVLAKYIMAKRMSPDTKKGNS